MGNLISFDPTICRTPIQQHLATLFQTSPQNFEGLQNTTLDAHIESNAYVTGCLVCGKAYEQVFEETVVDYLHQTAEPKESVGDNVLMRNAFLDGLQGSVFNFIPRGVSQVTTGDGLIYTVNHDNPQRGTQINLLPLFED